MGEIGEQTLSLDELETDQEVDQEQLDDLDVEDGELEDDPEPPEEGETDSEELEGDQDSSESEEEEDDSDEIYLSFDEEEKPESSEKSDSARFRQLRKKLNETLKENLELKRQSRSPEGDSQDGEEDIGPEPTLESCEYDEELFKSKLIEHQSKKLERESEKRKQREKQQAVEEAWSQKLEDFEVQKSKIGNDDYELYEDLVNEKLSPAQKSLIIHSSENPAHLVWSLGNSPDDLERLSKIQEDPLKFAFEVGKFQSKREAKVVKKGKKPPAPEKRVSGTAPRRSGSGDAKLEKLRAEAERTGNYTKLHQYKQSLSSK